MLRPVVVKKELTRTASRPVTQSVEELRPRETRLHNSRDLHTDQSLTPRPRPFACFLLGCTCVAGGRVPSTHATRISSTSNKRPKAKVTTTGRGHLGRAATTLLVLRPSVLASSNSCGPLHLTLF